MISIIIPVLNEEGRIGELIRELEKTGSGSVGEIIVVDGGSLDRTVEFARDAGARVVVPGLRGRSRQMNAGAREAQFGILYFLHADTTPPRNFDRLIDQSVKNGYPAGCFRLRFDDPHPALRFYSWFTRLDIDLFRFGDQSLFMTREIFDDCGGFKEDLILMEDQEMVRRARRYGRFLILKESVTTSARKYRENGYFRLQFLFTVLLFLYYAGVRQETLVDLYKRQIR